MKTLFSRWIAPATLFCLTLAVGRPSFAETYEIDPVHSSVVFRIKHSDLNYVYGMFTGLSGKFGMGPEGTFDINVDVGTILSGNEARDNHLKSPDFFSARQFPMITFTADSAQATENGEQEVEGQLTLKGVTKPITIKLETATGAGRGGEIRGGIHGSFTIQRSDFNLGSPGGVGNDVTIMVSFQGVQQ